MINYVYQLQNPRIITVKFEDIKDLENKILVRPLYMALCHADQRYYTGNRDKKVLKKKLPMALIHECCGEVIMDKSNKFKKGELVALIPNVAGYNDDEIFENYGEGAKFLSSGYDGFMREYIDIERNQVISLGNIDPQVGAITEFVTIGVHGLTRFNSVAHSKKNTIGIWGDGSLAFIVANILKITYKDSKIIVFGKNREKLSLFSFVDETILIDEIGENLKIDHAFECVGGEGSGYAIDDMIKHIKPQGTIVLMGVSENKVPINTRDILEKGITMIGCSRSGYKDFEKAIEIMKIENVQKRLKLIIDVFGSVKNISDIHKVFEYDLTNPFKTVFKWEI